MSNRAKKRALTPWLDSAIYEEKIQTRLFRKFIKSNNPEDHRKYKIFQKRLSKKKRRVKRKYYRNLLSNAKNSDDKSATWNVINGILGSIVLYCIVLYCITFYFSSRIIHK